MRVGLVAWDYPPSPSGLSTAAREIAESLAEAGASLTVFTADRDGRSVESGIEIIGCRPDPAGTLARLRRIGAIGHLAAPLAIRRAVLREHRKRAFDIVEATNWYAPAALLTLGARVPLVTRNSTPAAFSRDAPASLRDRIDGAFADALERWQAGRSAGLISNTRAHAERIAAEYGLPDGEPPHRAIGLSLSPETIARGRAASYPPSDASEPVRLLFVGRAEARKGFDLLMGAASILAAEAEAGSLPDFVLRLVGVPESDLPAEATPAARQRIIALGRLPEAMLAAEYEAAHAVLAPSRYESFGLVYQEGIAYGRPMVALAMDASGREFVGDSGAGRLARDATAGALADAIRPLVTDPALRDEFRVRALRAAGRFDRATLGRETLALYAQALRAGSSRKTIGPP